MNIIFFEDQRECFLPLVFTRPIASLRVGILTVAEKWVKYLEKDNQLVISYLTEDYLSVKYPLIEKEENLFINSRFCPNDRIIEFINENLNSNEAIFYKETLVVAKCSINEFEKSSYHIKDYNDDFVGIELKSSLDIFLKNGEAIEADFNLITKGRDSQKLSATNTIIGNSIFVEEGAKVEAAVLNSNEGPIYIGAEAEVMEGSVVRGPLAMCSNSVLKLATKIYGPTTVGKYSKVGGELNNVVVQDFSNKGHDGFVGNSVIGEWCNLGADTNTSNLKNNYSEVKTWSYKHESVEGSGLQFCGLIMGDHSKCGINTMFNTGTVVGVNANVFGGDFPSKFIPSYSWGGSSGFETYQLEKSFEVSEKVMERRGVELTKEDKDILTNVFNITSKFRK